MCGGDIPCGTLTQATASNIEAIRTQLQNYSPSGSTNFEAAFQLAFSVLEQTGEFTSNCHSSILFMTDGEITVGKSGNSFLSYVDTLQDDLFAEAGKRAVLFTFSFGTGADETIPKALACAHNGTWSPVEYNANLRQQMGNYYDYFASLRASDDTPVVWVEPYEDASGAGIVRMGVRSFDVAVVAMTGDLCTNASPCSSSLPPELYSPQCGCLCLCLLLLLSLHHGHHVCALTCPFSLPTYSAA